MGGLRYFFEHFCYIYYFVLVIFVAGIPSVLWHCWLGVRKGIWTVKSWNLVCWWRQFDWIFACLIAPVVTTNSIVLAAIKSRMATFWYRLTQVHLENGRWKGERESYISCCLYNAAVAVFVLLLLSCQHVSLWHWITLSWIRLGIIPSFWVMLFNPKNRDAGVWHYTESNAKRFH